MSFKNSYTILVDVILFMKQTTKLFLVVVLMAAGVVAEPLQLTSAKVGDSTNLQGSLRGGTTLTIEGIGFDIDNPQLYQVFVGVYPC